MSYLQVTPHELRAAAHALTSSIDPLSGLSSQLDAAAVPSGAFGQLPYISSHLESAYDKHVSESARTLQDATEGAHSSVHSLRATAEAFEHVEKANHEIIHKVVPQ